MLLLLLLLLSLLLLLLLFNLSAVSYVPHHINMSVLSISFIEIQVLDMDNFACQIRQCYENLGFKYNSMHFTQTFKTKALRRCLNLSTAGMLIWSIRSLRSERASLRFHFLALRYQRVLHSREKIYLKCK